MHMNRHAACFMQGEVIVTKDCDAGDGAVLTAVSMLRSLLTETN